MKKNLSENKKPKSLKKKEDILKACLQICDDVQNGLSLVNACRKNNLSRSAFYEKLNCDENLANKYARARERSTDSMLDEFDALMKKLEAGEIDSSTARVLLDALKWKLSKFYPKMYGDMQKTQLVDENGSNPFEIFYKAICEKKDYTR